MAFWTRCESACSRPAGSALALEAVIAIGNRSGESHFARRHQRRDYRHDRRASAAAPIRAAPPGERRASRSFSFLHRALQRRDHVGAELGIVGVALGVAGDQRELAHQILDVVHDEGEAPVELVETLGVGKRLLAARFGDIARGLDAGGTEQVEVLPVERPSEMRMLEDDQADQLAGVDQGHAGPGLIHAGKPCRRQDPLVAPRPASRRESTRIRRHSGPASMNRAQGFGAVARSAESARSSSSGQRATKRYCASRQQEDARRRSADIGERLYHSFLERRAVLALPADRIGEAQPFLAIVVAVLEDDAWRRSPAARRAARADGSSTSAARVITKRPGRPAPTRRPIAADHFHRPRRRASSRSDRSGWRSARSTGRSRHAKSAASSWACRVCPERRGARAWRARPPRIVNSSSPPPCVK